MRIIINKDREMTALEKAVKETPGANIVHVRPFDEKTNVVTLSLRSEKDLYYIGRWVEYFDNVKAVVTA